MVVEERKEVMLLVVVGVRRVGLYSVDVCAGAGGGGSRFPILMMLSDGECLLIVPCYFF